MSAPKAHGARSKAGTSRENARVDILRVRELKGNLGHRTFLRNVKLSTETI